MSYLIEDDIENRTFDFTENVYAIAFMENKNTGTECVYYDLPDRKRYQTSDAYLFDDLYQTQAGYYADGQQMVEALDKYGVSAGNPEQMKRRSQIPSTWCWQWNMRTGLCSV